MIRLLMLTCVILSMPFSQAQDAGDAVRERLVKRMERSMEICEIILASKEAFTGARQGLVETTKDISRHMHLLCNSAEFKDDEEYRRWLTWREGPLRKMQIMIATENYEDTVVAFGKAKQTCTTCHDKFRAQR